MDQELERKEDVGFFSTPEVFIFFSNVVFAVHDGIPYFRE